MKAGDVDAAMQLKKTANWNQTAADWERILGLEPEGCFVDERAGTVTGTTTALRYGTDLAWIGMVLVLPRFRRAGIATGLMRHAMAWIRDRGVRVARLDATAMGRPLYLRLGFRDEEVIERWEKTAPGEAAAHSARSGAFPERLLAVDRQAFGCDRSHLIRHLASDPAVDSVLGVSGFAFCRPGSEARQLGPCVAADAQEAESLLRDLISARPDDRFVWDFLPSNHAAGHLARRLGFRRSRKLVRMALTHGSQDPVRPTPSRVFAAAGFEFG